MSWFKKPSNSSSAKPLTTLQPSLGQANIHDVAAQALRFIPPVYEHYAEAERAQYLLKCTKMLRSWADILNGFSTISEAALLLLDDRVTVLGIFYRDRRAADCLENISRLQIDLGMEAHAAVCMHYEKLVDSVDYALARLVNDGISVSYQPRNGQGISRGVALLNRHERRFRR